MQNQWDLYHDTILEENCRLNTDFEEREVNLGDIKDNPEFWKLSI